MIDGNLSCSYQQFFAWCGIPWYFTCKNKIWLLCGSLIAITYYFIIVLSTFLISFFLFLSILGGLGNRLDLYIHDYLMKRQLHASARVFQAEGNVSTGPVGKIIIWAFLGDWNKVYAKVLSWNWPLLLATFPSYRST